MLSRNNIFRSPLSSLSSLSSPLFSPDPSHSFVFIFPAGVLGVAAVVMLLVTKVTPADAGFGEEHYRQLLAEIDQANEEAAEAEEALKAAEAEEARDYHKEQAMDALGADSAVRGERARGGSASSSSEVTLRKRLALTPKVQMQSPDLRPWPTDLASMSPLLQPRSSSSASNRSSSASRSSKSSKYAKLEQGDQLNLGSSAAALGGVGGAPSISLEPFEIDRLPQGAGAGDGMDDGMGNGMGGHDRRGGCCAWCCRSVCGPDSLFRNPMFLNYMLVSGWGGQWSDVDGSGGRAGCWRRGNCGGLVAYCPYCLRVVYGGLWLVWCVVLPRNSSNFLHRSLSLSLAPPLGLLLHRLGAGRGGDVDGCIPHRRGRRRERYV